MRYFYILIFTLISVVGAHGQQGKIYGDLSFFLLPNEANIGLSLGYNFYEKLSFGAQIHGISEEVNSFSLIGLEAKYQEGPFSLGLGVGHLFSFEETPEIIEFRADNGFYPYAKLHLSFRMFKIFTVGVMSYIHAPINGNVYTFNAQSREYDVFVESKKVRQEYPDFQVFVGFSFPKLKK